MKKLPRMALIAALYVAFTILPPFYTFSYGPIQVRVAEAFTVLPFLFPETIYGLTIGCFLANLLGQVGFLDFVFGTLITFLAALVTSKMKKAYLAPLPPVLFNAFGVHYISVNFFKFPIFIQFFIL